MMSGKSVGQQRNW